MYVRSRHPTPGHGLSKKQRLEKMRMRMESDRSSHMGLWQSLSQFIEPTRARFSPYDNRGDRRSDKIIDNTGGLAARTLSSGMMSGITSPARRWFRLTTPDPDLAEFGAVKDWLHVCTERLYWILARSNFYKMAPLIYKDMGVFATAGALLLEDDHTIIRFKDFPLGSFCFDVDEAGNPVVFTRHFRMTVRQLVRKFGYQNCSSSTQNLWDKGDLETLIEVVHVVEPNEEMNPDSLYSMENKLYYSCYYEYGANRGVTTDQMLGQSGFEEFPGLFPIWEGAGEDVYGTNSPGILALSDIKSLQTMEKRGLHGLEKQVNPPMVGPNSLRSAKASTLPGDITYLDVREGQKGFQPAHEVNLALDKLEIKEQQKRQIIERAFFSDLFLMMSLMDENGNTSEKTAAEIYERHEEKLLALGPVLETLNGRWLDPTIDRAFAIADRRGLMPPPPEELEGVDLKIEYISMMHQAQKSQALGGLTSVVNLILPIAERDPSILDKWDLDKWSEHLNEAAGTPPDIVRPQEQVDEIRAARAQEQARAKEAEQQELEAKAAKTLSETDTQNQNALTDLMSMGGGQNVPIA